ncbi:MAG: transporter [Dehalococcoidia bacterium]|nr:transporter [Dehalococcoidia bacterium]
MLPDGDKEPPPSNDASTSNTDVHGRISDDALDTESFTVRQAMATKAFWLISIGFSLRLMVTGAVVVHQIPYLESIGIPTAAAATILGSLGVVSVVGRFGFAWLADRYNKQYITAFCCALLGFGMLILVSAQSTWHLILYLIVYAPGYGGLTTMMPLIKADYFGRKAFGTILGVSGLIQMVGTVTGPFFAGWVYDVTQSYHIAFLTFSGASFLSMVIFLLAKRPVKKDTVLPSPRVPQAVP